MPDPKEILSTSMIVDDRFYRLASDEFLTHQKGALWQPLNP